MRAFSDRTLEARGEMGVSQSVSEDWATGPGVNDAGARSRDFQPSRGPLSR